MDFDERLDKAISRGTRRGDAQAREAAAKAISQEELKKLHSQYRLQVSEHIEKCVEKMANHFPGFRLENIYGESGWGAGCSRDDFGSGGKGQRKNFYSRFESTVKPISGAIVIEIIAKGTIRNKEVFNRRHFEKVADIDIDTFLELIDRWVLEYAELFAAS